MWLYEVSTRPHRRETLYLQRLQQQVQNQWWVEDTPKNPSKGDSPSRVMPIIANIRPQRQEVDLIEWFDNLPDSACKNVVLTHNDWINDNEFFYL